MVSSTPPPQRLGDGHGDGNASTLNDSGAKMLSPDEMRRRRLEALDRSSSSQLPLPSSVAAPAIPQAVTFVPDTIATNMNANNDDYFPDDEVDDELQAALALSLQDVSTTTSTAVDTTISNIKAEDCPSIDGETPSNVHLRNDNVIQFQEQQQPPLPPQLSMIPNQSMTDNMVLDHASLPTTNHTTIVSQGEPLQNISMYHKILWDDHLTTESDKNRWVSQGIDVRCNGSSSESNTMMETDTSETTKATIGLTSTTEQYEGIEILHQPPSEQTSSTMMMETVTASLLPWGLIQQHGGPCGVLAAVQAELLRTLLFDSGNNNKHATATIVEHRNDTTNPLKVREALARAIAVILSRATLASPSNSKNERSTAVHIVLPTNENQSLTWQDLEPWYPVQPNSSVPSSALKVYRIPIEATDETSSATSTAINASLPEINNSNSTITPKRQKVVPGDSSTEAMSSPTKRPEQSLHTRIDRMAHIVEQFLLNENCDQKRNRGTSTNVLPASSPLDSFRRPGGVLLLVISLIASRTIPVIMDDFDDPIGTRLTAQFGHCGQELINLLLTGQAVSNVFDNTLSPSGDMVCRGIQSRPVIGYLTQLEAMRYCEVGGYYKMPLFPIWVVGSTSHFTVLFGDLAALKESKSDMLLDECRRAFKAVEGGEENGFIQTEQLTSVLKSLKIDIGGSSESDEAARIQTLGASLEVSGAGIILWDDFWKAVSRLLTGASLETVLHSSDGTGSLSPINVDNANEPPLLLSNYAANDDVQFRPEARRPTAAVASAQSNYIESDEEMARRLAAEWENAGAAGGMLALSNAAETLNFPPALSDVDPQPASMGDEEYAQYLQRQYDSENAVDAAIAGGEGGSVAAISGSPFPALSDTDETSSIPATPTQNLFAGEDDFEDTKPAAQMTMSTESLTFEQYGDSFSLFHYNGLRGGVLTPFRITRLTAEEAVGASIALNRGTGVATSHGSSGTQDLEDVVRTKWPSCVINWLGKTPPCID